MRLKKEKKERFPWKEPADIEAGGRPVAPTEKL
jgi:hypothetical protein